MHKYIHENLYIFIYVWRNDMNVYRGKRCMLRAWYISFRGNEETKEDTKMKNKSKIGDDWWKETKTVTSREEYSLS